MTAVRGSARSPPRELSRHPFGPHFTSDPILGFPKCPPPLLPRVSGFSLLKYRELPRVSCLFRPAQALPIDHSTSSKPPTFETKPSKWSRLLLSSVVTPRSPAPLSSSRRPRTVPLPSPGTSLAMMPMPSVACTSTPLVTTPTAAPPPALTSTPMARPTATGPTRTAMLVTWATLRPMLRATPRAP
ncbi:hypothetical protein QC763_117400 [Podospora pseudopauciseta]|uniref:Uncharacterized protein n=2 Tax=Podospora TaxID=5144 RepID=A0ABR0I149_9PEZI|nr:hypothetical protein QC763_117400 [Podospora pseudopauciseta]KAK4682584.1 hypothetical protein QC764_117400 [Podospora pseudoanserina]